MLHNWKAKHFDRVKQQISVTCSWPGLDQLKVLIGMDWWCMGEPWKLEWKECWVVNHLVGCSKFEGYFCVLWVTDVRPVFSSEKIALTVWESPQSPPRYAKLRFAKLVRCSFLKRLGSSPITVTSVGWIHLGLFCCVAASRSCSSYWNFTPTSWLASQWRQWNFPQAEG